LSKKHEEAAPGRNGTKHHFNALAEKVFSYDSEPKNLPEVWMAW